MRERSLSAAIMPPITRKGISMFKRITVALCAVAMLSACQSVGNIDASIQKSAPALCAAATPLHETFITVAATGIISQKTADREAAAWSVVEPICLDPSHATSTTILIAMANAYIVISQAVREAKAAKAAQAAKA
jgi:hypothetical protein